MLVVRVRLLKKNPFFLGHEWCLHPAHDLAYAFRKRQGAVKQRVNSASPHEPRCRVASYGIKPA